MQSFRYCPLLITIKKNKKTKQNKNPRNLVKVFAKVFIVLYRVGDWDDLHIDLYVSLRVGFKIQFAGIVPVFSEFNFQHLASVPRRQ